MKRLVIATLALVLLGSFLIFDSQVTGQRRTSSNSNMSTNTRPTLNRRRETNTRSSTNTGRMSKMGSMTPEESLTAEAQQLAEDYWGKIPTKCSDTYYWKGDSNYEAKGEPIVYLDKSEYSPPKQLTPAQKLNNVDPQPIEFYTQAVVYFEVGRYFQGDLCDTSVCPWKDGLKSTVILTKSKGQWHIQPVSVRENKPVRCDSSGAPIRGRQGINIDAYCKSKYGNSAQVVLSERYNAESWKCKTPDGSSLEIDMGEACRMQHGNTYEAKFFNRGKPDSWYCID